MANFRPENPTRRRTNAEAWGRWGEEQIAKYFGISRSARAFDAFRSSTFFITITLSPEDLLPLIAANGHTSRGDGYDASYVLDQGTDFYARLCRLLRAAVPPGTYAPPLVLLGVDFDDSRRIFRRPDRLANLHIHALLVVRPEHGDAARRVLAHLQFLYRHKLATYVDALDVRPFDFGRYTLRETLSYIMKGEAAVRGEIIGELLVRQYPGPYALSRKYQPPSAAGRGRRRFRRAVERMSRQLALDDRPEAERRARKASAAHSK